MFSKSIRLLTCLVLLLSMALIARAQAPQQESVPQAAQSGPTLEELSWSDFFGDDIGLLTGSDVTTINGDLVLSQIVPLATTTNQSEILAITEGPDGKIYMGTDGASLQVYDPATGLVTNLGYPVLAECYG